MINVLRFSVIAAIMTVTSAFAQSGDISKDCYQQMLYNVSVQLAGTSYGGQDLEKQRGNAYYSGAKLGISKAETDRMIVMASGSPYSARFAYQYLSDDSFANAYRSGFINDCKSKPANGASQ